MKQQLGPHKWSYFTKLDGGGGPNDDGTPTLHQKENGSFIDLEIANQEALSRIDGWNMVEVLQKCS